MLVTLSLLMMSLNGPASYDSPTRASSAFRSPITSGAYAGGDAVVAETGDKVRARVPARRRAQLNELRVQRNEEYRNSVTNYDQPGSWAQGLLDNAVSTVDSGFNVCSPIHDTGFSTCGF